MHLKLLLKVKLSSPTRGYISLESMWQVIEVIDGFLLLDSEDIHQKAKEMLVKRFADPYAVAAAYH